MVVLSLSNCPIGLRGDISKWLFEISAGVYVGNINKRVRDILWQHIKDKCHSGNATMVFSMNNEQKFDFKVHGNVWEPIDYDGIKLVLHPSPSRLKNIQTVNNLGFSNEAKRRSVKRFEKSRNKYPIDYFVLDLEMQENTSKINDDNIINGKIDISIVKVVANEIIESVFVSLLNKSDIESRLKQIGELLKDMPLVVYNENDSFNILQNLCVEYKTPVFLNRCIDTLALAKRLYKGLSSYDNDYLTLNFHIENEIQNNSNINAQCIFIHKLYMKLIENE